MPIERLRLRELSPEERADLELARTDPTRCRHEDRKLFVMFLVMVSAWLMVLEVFLLYEVRRWHGREDDPLASLEGFFGAFPESLSLLWQANLVQFAGVVVLPLVMAALVVHAWRTAKAWNGYVLASFGFVRMRGDALRVLRYRDIAEVRIEKGSEIFHGRNQVLLRVLDAQGKGLVAQGYGFDEWKRTLEARRPAPRSIDDPSRRSQVL